MNPRDASDGAIINALTIDVEDYFQVSAFAQHVPRTSWDAMPCRVERNIDRVLELLAEAEVCATFFALGWIAERYPEMIRRIVEAGHELASHGYEHRRATDQGYGEFLADIRLAKAVLEDIAGAPVRGYRAPSFSIGPRNRWAFECIADAGYRYSSSIYPIRHDHYGAPGGAALRARSPHRAPRGADRHGARAAVDVARGRRRLLPVAAVPDLALVAAPHQRRRGPARDVLLPSVGTRSRAAACRGPRRQGAVSPLPQPRTDGVAPAAARRGFPVGPRRPDLPEWRRMMGVATEAVPRLGRAAAPLVVRDFAPGDAERWDAFVGRCPEATFFHRIGWRGILEDVFRHRTHYRLAERGGEIAGVLPLAEVKSRLFGHALVSLPFCVYGGPAASDADAERALVDAAVDLARTLGVEHLELRHRAAKCPGWPRQDLYVTFRRELAPDAEANLLAIPRKQRAMIRKGIRHGLVARDRRVGRPLLRAVRGQRAPPRHAAVREEVLRAPARGLRRRLRGAGRHDGGRPARERRAELLFPRRGASVLRRRHGGGARACRQRLQVLGS